MRSEVFDECDGGWRVEGSEISEIVRIGED